MTVETATTSLAGATSRRYGGHSLTAPLRTVLVRRPARPATGDDWRTFGFLHPVNHERAEREHAVFRSILAREGIEVIEAGPDEDGQLDAIFTYDPSLMTDGGAIILRMGKEARRDEPALHAATYRDLGIPVLGTIEAPGTVEGGDTLWLDERTLAVGRGYRTNEAGIQQLRRLVVPLDVEVLAFDLPHWKGAGECLHLMSLISPVADRLAVVYLPLMAVALVQELQDRGWRLVEIPDDEFATMGCNVLALAPGRCLMLDGNPGTRQCLEAAGCQVLTYEGTEISLNRAGGPTCLTRPIWRDTKRRG